jgi:sugar lactone lactonase YvrE
LCALLLAAPAFATRQVDTLAARANAAYHAHQYPAMEADVGKLLELLPGFLQGIYFQAIARAGQGDRDGAFRALERLAGMGLYFDIRKQAILKGLRDAPGFAAVEQRFAANLKQVGSVEPAFELAGKDFLPEGIARDPDSGDFFVSSVHLRKIVRVHQGHVTAFADRRSGLDGVLGIRTDAARGVLWVTSAALPQMQGYDPKDKGRTALFRFDLRDGARSGIYRLPEDGDHQFNDLDVAPDGTVYVADGNGGIYVLKPGASRLEPLTSPGALRSAQGLAVSSDGNHLYVADYAGGLFIVDPETRKLKRMRAPSDVCVYGIDGLSMVDGDLVATQNGIQPQRIVRYRLGGKGLAVKSVEVLDANDPRVPAPALLTVVNHTLYVVANSQWSRFDDRGRPKEGAVLRAPRIVKLALH